MSRRRDLTPRSAKSFVSPDPFTRKNLDLSEQSEQTICEFKLESTGNTSQPQIQPCFGGQTPQRSKDQITIGLFNDAPSEQHNRTLPLQEATEHGLIDIEINN